MRQLVRSSRLNDEFLAVFSHEVRSSLGAIRNAAHLLRIRDSGIGIAQDVLPHVFNLFMQADHSARRAEAGLGIGLALVKSLVEMHGGSVTAASAGLGQGSEFVVCLPALGKRAT